MILLVPENYANRQNQNTFLFLPVNTSESSMAESNHHPETHGMRNEIDENTTLSDVKAPNVLERAKEEFEALFQTLNDKREQYVKVTESKLEKSENGGVKAPSILEKVKEEVEAIFHQEKSTHHHHKETHGRSDDIDENTPIDEVKGPSILERAKEEVEALVQTIHPKKESAKESGNFLSSPKKESGFGASIGRGLERVCSPGKADGIRASIGKGLEKVCSPWNNKRD